MLKSLASYTLFQSETKLRWDWVYTSWKMHPALLISVSCKSNILYFGLLACSIIFHFFYDYYSLVEVLDFFCTSNVTSPELALYFDLFTDKLSLHERRQNIIILCIRVFAIMNAKETSIKSRVSEREDYKASLKGSVWKQDPFVIHMHGDSCQEQHAYSSFPSGVKIEIGGLPSLFSVIEGKWSMCSWESKCFISNTFVV